MATPADRLPSPSRVLAVAAHPEDADAACAAYEAWRAPVARQYEMSDPGRYRLRGAVLGEPLDNERWPPRAE